MKRFEKYLYGQGYAKGTVESYLRSANFFSNWCNSKGFELETIDYKSCLGYVKYLQQIKNGKRLSKSTVKHQIGALKILFNYLIDDNGRHTNPMQSMNIRGIKRTLNHNLLEYDELEDLYYSYPTRNIKFPSSPQVALRNKVITGFMVYQGLNTTALKSLKLEHIDINKGKLYVPSTRKTNSRTLELKSWQIVPLLQYIEQDREILQDAIQSHTDALFPLNSDRFDIILRHLFKRLKRINYKVKDVKQIRASVITHSLSSHNIREVQYMMGHRFISSTEAYLQDDLENLHQMIESMHPIN
ncbi:tyrosine-type recombinase/integrase [uncultured Psychroserpens sp.]|uniref:tyrosine-type recombinase/integrase n=1 Tax=uncultured Psychroserpens sp. TaxID=255436 RepID=UPI0026293D2F|nr:tyrosine-type recombinase/integrase [uncultured Psychroserpens sp.]